MPRANRHFLPGYIWHITHSVTKKFVQNVPVVQPLRSVDGGWKEQGYFGAPETKVESFVSRCHVLRSVRVTEMTYLSSPVLNRKFGGVALL